MLQSKTLKIQSLKAETIDGMWRLFQRYYADVDYQRFRADLAAKQQVIVLFDGDCVAGFSTLLVRSMSHHGRRALAVYSGDTVIDQAYWGQTVLQTAFFQFMIRMYLTHPLTDIYWFLISKGYKTYLLLSRNFVNHWPRHDQATPAAIAAMRDELAADMFGHDYDPASGVIRFSCPQGKLKDHVAPITAQELQHPDIRFFASANPGHQQGDELCCIGKFDSACIGYYAVKLMIKTLRNHKLAQLAKPVFGR